MRRILLLVMIGFAFLGAKLYGSSVILAAESKGTFKLPDYDKFILKNGMTVYLMEQHEVPLVYISIVFPAGAVFGNAKGYPFGSRYSCLLHQTAMTLALSDNFLFGSCFMPSSFLRRFTSFR